MEIVARHVIPQFHAVVMPDGEHPVEGVYQSNGKLVIQAANLSLLRSPKDLVSVVVIGGGPSDDNELHVA